MRAWKLALTVGVALIVAGLIAVAAPAGAKPDRTTFSYQAGMNGQKEVPGPGDKNASGHAVITVDTVTGSICWDLRVRKIDGTVTAAHIHAGDRRTAGPVVQALTPPASGESSGCATNMALAGAIAADPHEYYVNVHSTVFPGGAVRGQLAGRHS